MSEAEVDDETPRVLIVDDEPDLAEMYAEFLRGSAEVRTADGGEAALEMIDDDVDVVFLDREMPGMEGDEVLEAIRDRGYDCYVAMLTGVKPDLDVFDMPFDEYVVKPVSQGDLQEKLDQLLQRSAFGEDMRELFAKTSKRNAVSDDEAGKAWSKREISTIVDQAEVAPAPGVFGGWNSGEMAMREEKEREFSESIERLPLPVLLERVAQTRGDATAQAFPMDAHPRSMAEVIGDIDDDIVALSNEQVRDVVRTLALGFDGLGVSSDSPVLLAAGPRAEAAWCDFAVLAAGGVVVGTDPDASDATLQSVIDRTDPLGAVVETTATLSAWDDRLAEACEFVIVLDDLEDPGAYESMVSTLGTLYREADHQVDPNRYTEKLERTAPDSPAGLVLSEGISPLLLTHGNLVENAAQVYSRLAAEEGPVGLGEGDRILTAFPPSEPWGRVVNHYLRLTFGGTTVYADSAGGLLSDARRVQPALLAAPTEQVSQLAEDVTGQVIEAGRFASEGVLDWATSAGADHRYETEPGIEDQVMEWAADRLGMSNFRQILGAPEAVLVATEPLDSDAHERYHGAGIVPVCGYAADRSGTFLSVSPPEDPRPGTLGVPLYDEEVEVKWTPSVPPDQKDGDIGELAVKGPNVPGSVWGTSGSKPFAENDLLKTGEMIKWDQDDYFYRQS